MWISLSSFLLTIITTITTGTYGSLNHHEFKDKIPSNKQHLNPQSLVTRIRSHDFCTTEFLLDVDDQLPKNTFFVPCSNLDEHFIDCDHLTVPKIVNGTKVFPCPHFGTSKEGKPYTANVTCRVLPCIECYGPRNFTRTFACKKYTGYYFISALLYSIFLGLFAADRFYLGYSAIAVGKLMTLGGLGVWWLVDIFLLLNGHLRPADSSEWQPFWQ